jgi:hypothetical protein
MYGILKQSNFSSKARSYAQSLQPSSERAQFLRISKLMETGFFINGIAQAIASDGHNSDGAILRVMLQCVAAGLAEHKGRDESKKYLTGRIVFPDGSIWETNGCSPALSEQS